MPTNGEKPRCHATNKQGEPCAAAPLTGKNYCGAHDPELPESSRFGSVAQAKEAAKLGGRPRNPRPTERLQQIVEENLHVFLRPHLLTLGLEINADGSISPTNGGMGARMFGESKDGEIVASEYEDLGAQIEAVEKVFNRVYGRPKQVSEVSGPDGGPVTTALVTDPKLSEEALDLLARASSPSEE